MFPAFLLFAFLATSGGTPLTANPLHSANMETHKHSLTYVLSRELPQCSGNCRTTSQIIWSCVATIFACAWVAIHPNLPGPRESGFQRFQRRITVAILTIIAPELIALLAARQWSSAKAIKKEFNEKFNDGDDPDLSFSETVKSCLTVPFYATKEWFMGPPNEVKRKWTLTHGFFVQMGGFMMYHNGEPVQVLTFDRLLKAIETGEIDVPHIPEEDITNMSKGDGLSKLIVVLQTTWFVAQCLGRWASLLPVTELEVSTLAFAVLNAFIYALWWSKPQGILVPIRLEFTPPSLPSNSDTFYKHPELNHSSISSQPSSLQRTLSSSVSLSTSNTLSDAESTPFLVLHKDARREESAVPFIEEEFDKGSSHWMRWKFDKLPIHSTSSLKRTWEKFLSLPIAFLLIVQYPFRVALKTFGFGDSKTASTDSARKFEVGRSRVPMFYADDKHGADNSAVVAICFLIIPPMYGGIHITLWSACFNTPLDQLLWRISAVYITVSALLPFMLLLALLLESFPKLPLNAFIENTCASLFRGLSILVTCLYPAFRGILIFISLHTLAHLSNDAYYDVNWANLLPHI